jgi:hypothetical protein
MTAQTAPESTSSIVNSHLHIDVEEEERKILTKGKNNECKDDFWIGVSDYLS